MARPSKYDPDVTPILAEQYARDGLIDEEIANKLGIARSTLSNWKNKYPEFSDALKNGKEVVDAKVEKTLLNKALEGDTTAIIFWLKNRKPEQWRNNPENQGHDDKLNNLIEGLKNAPVSD